MARSSNSSKAVAWRRRVGRFESSGLTVVRFCEKEGVSTASFYRWRNLLGEQRAIAESTDERPTGTPGGVGNASTFLPVRVTRADAPVSIQLPGGVRVEVPAENLDAVRVVLGELLRQNTTPDRGGSSC